MQYRTLGRTGIQVSEIGFGAWGIGGGWGPTDNETSLRALREAFDLGITFYDTAAGYGNGTSETLIGRAFDGQRDRVVIASKVPPKNFRWPAKEEVPLSEIFPARWIIQSTERSLRNLKTDYLDLQQLHAWTPAYLQQTEWLDALQTLKQQGKIRAFGVSTNDWDPYGAVSLVQSGNIDVVQVIYNIFEQRPEEQLFPAALENTVGILARVPFEEGLLTGAYLPGHVFDEKDWRKNWLTPDRLAEAHARVDRLRGFLDAGTTSLAALALKFCLSHPAVSSVIPGMRRVENVIANAAVSDGSRLPEDVRAALHGEQFVHGWSYPWSQ